MKPSVMRATAAGLIVAATAGLGGCGSDYTLFNSVSSYVEEDGALTEDHNTIMVDRATGQTWVLWSGDNYEAGGESGYYWVPIKRVEFTLPPELAKTRVEKPQG